MGNGLQRVLKQIGSVICEGEDGKKVVWYWDYVNDKPRLKSEMTDAEINASMEAKRKLNENNNEPHGK
jgi:hypothetical protein